MASNLKRFTTMFLCLLLCFYCLSPSVSQASSKIRPKTITNNIELSPEIIKGLVAKVEVVEDKFGIPHIFAKNLKDVYFMQGMLHARDRFFQMDVTRRTVEGSLAELLGAGDNNVNIDSDVQLRAFNLKAAVNATLPMMRKETRDILKSYTKGVNAYLAANPLPPQYQKLKITQKRMWTEADTLLVGKGLALNLSFDIDDLTNTLALQKYQAAGTKQGFDGTALFFDDLFRTAPFDPSFAIPDATGKPLANKITKEQQEFDQEKQLWGQNIEKNIKPETIEMAQDYLEKIKNIPLLASRSNTPEKERGSNWFLLAGKLTDSGAPLLNNDPHLPLTSPPIWYQIQLNVVKGKKSLLNVTGVSLAGVPGVVLGHNDDIAWSATTSTFDVTDIYQEQIEAQFGNISIIHDGKKEPIIFRDETFRVNKVVDGKTDNIEVVPPSNSVPVRLPIVPRRNNGPIIGIDLVGNTALSVQFTGSGPTFEIETFLDFNRAKNITDFQKALEFFDVGSQNFGVVTTSGDVAYFTSGEIPIREDLQAGKISGAPPTFIRNGVTGNEWIAKSQRPTNQALNYEVLPFSEMPQVVNPTNGFIVTANADPIGITANGNPFERKRANGGIYYLGNSFSNGSRASRLTLDIQDTLKVGKKITVEMARRFQADIRMRDAEILMPHIQTAFSNAQKQDAPADLAALAKDPAIIEAVTRFKTWDFSSPTGLRLGYDAFVPYNQAEPSQQQIDSSVSTTIYSLWRSTLLRDTIDLALSTRQLTDLPPSGRSLAALRNLLENFSTSKGKGKSGISFFNVPNLQNSTPETQRDFILLNSLRKSLDTLAGPDFALAYQGSTKQSDYRWGFLHRIVFASDLGANSEFSIPSANSNIPSPLPGLPGLPRDGGFEVPNASSHSARANKINSFMFFSGPSKRSTIVMKPGAIDFTTAIPGGQSENPSNKMFDNLLQFWLVADVYPVVSTKQQITEQQEKVTVFTPDKE
ncbi:MAG: penicillin amidase [bacterium]|nr:MAG: penicillin amidase [bacterium]